MKKGLTMELWLAGKLLCSPDWPSTHGDLPTSASKVLGLKACITKANSGMLLLLSGVLQYCLLC